jgi:biotin transporter BioY
MGNKADLRRRWLGASFLAASLLMLIAGETILKTRLSQSAWQTLVYWMLCFLAVICAIIIAVLDMAVVRRRTREEQRGLFSETLEKIAREKEARMKKPDQKTDSSGSA